jgi:DNA-binding response OmpR family regulator
MPPAPTPREDEARLSGSRAEFIGSLPRRLETLRAALRVAEQTPGDPDRQNGLLRRLHAVASGARVLGFASVAEVLAEAERSVRKAVGSNKPAPFAEVARALDLLPSLVLGASVATRGAGARGHALPEGWPLSALVLGPQALADALIAGEGTARVECERADEATRALELARIMGPDIVVVDGDEPSARKFVLDWHADALIEPVPIVVVGSFDNPESTAAFVEIGAARVLPKPCSPDTLRRTVEELREQASQPRGGREPLGDLTVAALSDRIAAEIKRGLVDALDGGSPHATVPLGEGHDVMAAVWGAVARVRELVTLRSSGSVRFEQAGPEGSVPFASWGANERRVGERGPGHARAPEGVSLQGRRAVVADDDPAVVWFMSSLLKAVGVQVLEAHDGRRALERAFESWPDVVISDVMMPKLDGFSLCHELKRDVAVRDVPVILLSWKEDLLQRVRELGAAADGYLRKEATASAVVERVREVLRPRARVEERMAAGGEVRGRLDGLTTRLVLELACRDSRDVRISVRDAAYLFEAQIRGGELVALTRTAADGSFTRGAEVVGSLLGASAGRFVVQPDGSACRQELNGKLSEILAAPLTRARNALAAVSADSLVRLRRLELDHALVQTYLACTPEPAAGVLRRVLAGEAPSELVLSGAVSARLLELVLSDIARRGGVIDSEVDRSSLPASPPTPSTPAVYTEPLPATGVAALTSAPAEESSEDDGSGWFAAAVEASPLPPAMPPVQPVIVSPVAYRARVPAGTGTEVMAVVKLPEGTSAEPHGPGEAPAASGAPTPPPAAEVRSEGPQEPGEALRVPGAANTLPLDQVVTPGTDWASGPLFAFGPPEPTLDGVGTAPVTESPAAPPAEATHSPSEDASGDKPAIENAARGGEAAADEPPAADKPSAADKLPAADKPPAADEPPAADKPSAADKPPAADKPRARSRETPDPERSLPVPIETSRLPTMPPARPRAAAEEESGSVVGLLFKAVLAGGVAFAVTHFLILPLFSKDKPSPDAAPVSAGAPAPTLAPPPPLMVEELEPPAGIELSGDQGVIEVELASTDAIYVDGQLVGPGPIQRVPTAAGSHRVEVRNAAASSTIEVVLTAGRRARVQPATALVPAAPAPAASAP